MDDQASKKRSTPTGEKPEPLSQIPDMDIGALSDLAKGHIIDGLRAALENSELKMQERTDKNQPRLFIAIVEEPLTALSLSTTIVAVTDLHARCWFIQQNRLSDLMDYAQTRDPRYLKEANLQIGLLSHYSPTIIDFIVNAGGIAGGGATLAFAIKKGIDAVLQTSLRFEEMKLKNEREKLNQQIAAQKAEAEKRTTDQERQLAAQKAQIELEKQQLELDRQKLQLQQDRVKMTIEIATMVVSQLQSDSDAGQREMIIHSLVPPLLQLAATDIAMANMIPEPEDKEDDLGLEDE